MVIFLIPNCSIWNLFQTAFLLAPSFAQVRKIKYFYQLFPTFEGKIIRQNVKKNWSFSITFLVRVRFGSIFSNSFFFAVCIDSKNLSPFSSKSLLECSLLTNNQKNRRKNTDSHTCMVFSPFLGNNESVLERNQHSSNECWSGIQG